MIAPSPAIQPFGAALWLKALRAMDVILHIGAHRCATTSFQTYMRMHRMPLTQAGIGFWGPIRTRSGLFRGIVPGPGVALGRDLKKRAIGRVQLSCAQTARQGAHTLVVSDENMVGTMRANLRLGELYSGAGERMAQFAEAFDGHLSEVVLNIRRTDDYWASVLAFFASKGRGVPPAGLLRRLAHGPRDWRHVISEVARAAPGVRVRVMPFETFAGRPDAQLGRMTDLAVPVVTDPERHNQAPDLPGLRDLMQPKEGVLPGGSGRWMPFAPAQQTALRERYADDLMWLAAGADGLAELIGDPAPEKAGQNLRISDMTRGRHDERRHITVARAGRKGTARQAG